MHRVHRLILLTIILPLFLGCGQQSDTTSQTDMEITLSALSGSGKSRFAPEQFGIQRILLEVTGTGLDKISIEVPVTRETIEVLEDVVVPSGSRRFEAFAYDAEGLAYSGFVETVLAGGRRVVDITMVPVPRVSRLSLGQAIPGDTLKISGRVFGTPPVGEVAPSNSRVTVGGVEAEVVRWSDVAIVVVVPSLTASDMPLPVLVEFGEQKSDTAFTVLVQDQVIGVGGKDGQINDAETRLDGLIFPLSGGVTVGNDIANVAGVNRVVLDSAAPTLSVALSGDGSTVVEAGGTDGAQDVALSRNGGVALVADGSVEIQRVMGATDAITSVDCIGEVALSSDGNTAAAIGAPCAGGASRLYRIDDVLEDARFTLVAQATTGQIYTDVAMSEDASTVLVGWRTDGVGGTGGVHRILNFGTTPSLQRDTLPSGLARIDHVDVDLSADGITAIVGMQNASIPESVIFQIWDVDLPTDQPLQIADQVEVFAVVGVAVNSGGALGILRSFDDDEGAALYRFDQFNRVPAELPAPLVNSLLNTADDTVGVRRQDQVDLQ